MPTNKGQETAKIKIGLTIMVVLSLLCSVSFAENRSRDKGRYFINGMNVAKVSMGMGHKVYLTPNHSIVYLGQSGEYLTVDSIFGNAEVTYNEAVDRINQMQESYARGDIRVSLHSGAYNSGAKGIIAGQSFTTSFWGEGGKSFDGTDGSFAYIYKSTGESDNTAISKTKPVDGACRRPLQFRILMD